MMHRYQHVFQLANTYKSCSNHMIFREVKGLLIKMMNVKWFKVFLSLLCILDINKKQFPCVP